MQSSRSFTGLVLLLNEMNDNVQGVTKRIAKTAMAFADIRLFHFLLHPM